MEDSFITSCLHTDEKGIDNVKGLYQHHMVKLQSEHNSLWTSLAPFTTGSLPP